MRVAVVDLGSNSTRLLIADVGPDGVEPLERRSRVTRLAEGVDASGRLADAAQQRVLDVLDEYGRLMDARGCERRVGVLTSAVRDAANGDAFAAAAASRARLQARTLSGDEEARLTFLGAVAARPAGDRTPLVVMDIGGGSTELVTGAGGVMDFHVSTQVGVVRQSERHLHDDPPTPAQLSALARDARASFEEAVPEDARRRTREAVAVAGTATQAASVDAGRQNPDTIEGRRLSVATLERMLERLAAVPLDERRHTPGLDPERAPVMVAGLVIVLEALATFGLDAFTASQHDILWGAALAAVK